MQETQYLSKERYDELKQELDKLKGEGRAEVAEKLKRAKEYGDLSENAEYAEAREEQNLIEGRIFELEALLKRATMIEKEGGAGGAVRVGTTVTVEKNGKVMRYTIVGPYDAKPDEGKISDESPLGKAFLSRSVDDAVSVVTPAGKTTYKITKIE
ncbi:MAG: transcription elongation factor GreA [Candidatus Liptonbacteria bacterium]|nr:transcription elongation factor GreA [Candidatus Liptonbacteria bacterium]